MSFAIAHKLRKPKGFKLLGSNIRLGGIAPITRAVSPFLALFSTAGLLAFRRLKVACIKGFRVRLAQDNMLICPALYSFHTC